MIALQRSYQTATRMIQAQSQTSQKLLQGS